MISIFYLRTRSRFFSTGEFKAVVFRTLAESGKTGLSPQQLRDVVVQRLRITEKQFDETFAFLSRVDQEFKAKLRVAA